MSKEKKGLLKGLSGALPFDIQSTIGKVQAKIESISDNDSDDGNEDENISYQSDTTKKEGTYMFCSNCGTKLNAGAKFCHGCGAPVGTTSTPVSYTHLDVYKRQSTDRIELGRLLNISDMQMSYITNVEAGHGLIKVGSSIVPFANKFPKNTKLYKLMTTKFGEENAS